MVMRHAFPRSDRGGFGSRPFSGVAARGRGALVIAAFLGGLLAAGGPTRGRAADASAPPPAAPGLGAVREEARLHWRAQAEAAWAARASGQAPAPRASDPLLTKATIDLVRDQASAASDRDQKRRLRLLELYLVAESAAAADASGGDAGRRIAELGYQDYVTFSQAYRAVFLPPMMRDAMALARQTSGLYETLLAESTRLTLGASPVGLALSDFERIEASPDLYGFFPPELLAPAFREYLKGLGLEMTDRVGQPIREEPGSPVPTVYPVDIPSDVRLSAAPAGGLKAFRDYFREAGRALVLARTSASEWEYRHLGSTATREGLARLFETAWSDSAWLAHYRGFLAARTGHGPLPGDADLRNIRRRALFLDLVAFRRDVQATLIAECIDHGAPSEYVIPYFTEAGDDPKETWRTLLGFALGVEIPPDRLAGGGAPLTPYFLSADRAQGWALAATLEQGLSRRYGAGWRLSGAAGAFLTGSLFGEGTRLNLLDAAKAVGFTAFNYDPLFDRLCRAGEWVPPPPAPKPGDGR